MMRELSSFFASLGSGAGGRRGYIRGVGRMCELCEKGVEVQAEADNYGLPQIPTQDDPRHRHHLLYHCHQ